MFILHSPTRRGGSISSGRDSQGQKRRPNGPRRSKRSVVLQWGREPHPLLAPSDRARGPPPAQQRYSRIARHPKTRGANAAGSGGAGEVPTGIGKLLKGPPSEAPTQWPSRPNLFIPLNQANLSGGGRDPRCPVPRCNRWSVEQQGGRPRVQRAGAQWRSPRKPCQCGLGRSARARSLTPRPALPAQTL